MEFTNLFKEYGYPEVEIDQRVKQLWTTIFEDEESKVYYETEDGMGYVVDTGNIDVRTEGMSYAMLMAVEYDRKDIFDKLWRWVMTYMYMDEGENAHYFAWSVDPSGTKNSYGPAPDGEEFFAMDLFFASNRWGDGEGIFNYSERARDLLHYCLHKGSKYSGDPMWDPNNYLIKFIPNCDFTDPSYHLPHFYEQFALYANEEDRPFWKKAAQASREFLKIALHPETGLNPEYSLYDGSPQYDSEHPYFYSDAYRTALNVANDMVWYGEDAVLKDRLAKLQEFFIDANSERYRYVLTVEGEPTETQVWHPVGLIATLAAASLANKETDNAKVFVERLWNMEMRTGKYRYYDNFLYAFSFMALSGRYRSF